MREPFEVILSNYTMRIKSKMINYNSMNEEKSKQFFSASAKVKKDCLKKPAPFVDKTELKYFNFNLPTGIKFEYIYGIDLKNAYASILLKDGYISKETYFYLSTKLTKLDRLGALGMLAGKKKHIFFDEQGKEIEDKTETKVKETENYFFHAVQRTGEIMEQLHALIGNDFLFTWVDCIYFRSEKNLTICAEFLRDNDFMFHEKKYTKFSTELTKTGDTLRVIMFEVKEDGKEVFKIFHAPTKKKKIINDLSILLDKFAKK